MAIKDKFGLSMACSLTFGEHTRPRNKRGKGEKSSQLTRNHEDNKGSNVHHQSSRTEAFLENCMSLRSPFFYERNPLHLSFTKG